MRTVSFQSVYDAILRRLGLDPVGDAITYDTARAITEHVTERASTVWTMWDWPQLTVTEERAYRSPWNAQTQYRRENDDTLPDEVFYVPTFLYYRVNTDAAGDPPLADPPTTATAYWQEFEPVTGLVERDQLGQRSMAKVIGVYKSDPSLNGCAPHDICLKYRPTERGTYVCYAPLSTLFFCFIVEPPEYTMKPWIDGKAYVPGDPVFYHLTGQCYVCLAPTSNQPPNNPLFWAVQPVPAFFAPYLKAGAAADCLKETFAAGEDQVRLARAAALEAEADRFIEAEIDDLLAQGQKHYYIKPYWSNGWCLSEPWIGSVAIPLPRPAVSTPDASGDRITTFGDTRTTTGDDTRVTSPFSTPLLTISMTSIDDLNKEKRIWLT